MFKLSMCFLRFRRLRVSPHQDEIEIFRTTRYVLIVPLGLPPGCFTDMFCHAFRVAGLLVLFHIVEFSKPRPRFRALLMARVSIFEFCIKITYYFMLSNGTELAWQNMRCYDVRPIYLPRWTGWTFAIPTLLTMLLGLCFGRPDRMTTRDPELEGLALLVVQLAAGIFIPSWMTAPFCRWECSSCSSLEVKNTRIRAPG